MLVLTINITKKEHNHLVDDCNYVFVNATITAITMHAEVEFSESQQTWQLTRLTFRFESKVVTCYTKTLWTEHCLVQYNNVQDIEIELKTQQYACNIECKSTHEPWFLFQSPCWGLSNDMLQWQSPVQQLLTEMIQVANRCCMSQNTFASSKVWTPCSTTKPPEYTHVLHKQCFAVE